MILQTIQSIEAYEKMCRCGVLESDGEHILDERFRAAYKWMAEQMTQKIGEASDRSELPVWAWYQWEGEKYPDMKIINDENSSEMRRFVLITFDAPEDKVLLSDFDYWHFVLSDVAISDSDKEWFEYSADEKEESWQKIFDIKYAVNNKHSIQAVLWEIKYEWIRNVEVWHN